MHEIFAFVEEETYDSWTLTSKKKRKLVAADKRIMKILKQFVGNDPVAPPQTMWEFLHGISHDYPWTCRPVDIRVMFVFSCNFFLVFCFSVTV